MTKNEMEELARLVNSTRPTVTNNFNAPIGQHIDYVDTIVAHFDKDMNMQVAAADKIEAEPQLPQRTARQKCFASLVTQQSQREEVMELLHNVMWGKKGKAAALVMQCAREAGLIVNLPSWSSATAEFGDIGNNAGFYKYLSFDFTEEEKTPILKALKA